MSVAEANKNRPLTPKQEGFAVDFTTGDKRGNSAEAYRRNYNCENMNDQSVRTAAWHLLQNPKIQHRIEEIRGYHAKRNDITVERLTNLYVALAHKATELNQITAAVSALNSVAKMHGILTEKGIIEHNHQHSGTVAHNHQGVSRTLELLREFRGERPREHAQGALQN